MPPAQAEAIAKVIHDVVDPLARKVEAATAPHPTLEVLEERMKHMATGVQLSALTAEMNKLHGETMNRMGKMEGRIGVVEGRMGKIESEMAAIKWILSVFVAPLMVAITVGMIKLIFFP